MLAGFVTLVLADKRADIGIVIVGLAAIILLQLVLDKAVPRWKKKTVLSACAWSLSVVVGVAVCLV